MRNWRNTAPAMKGECTAVEIEGEDSAVMAQTLGTASEWGRRVRSRPRTYSVPDSSAWVHKDVDQPAIAGRIIPDLQPSIGASRPAVVSDAQGDGRGAGLAGTVKVTWQDVISKCTTNHHGWKALQKPKWGAFKFGMTDPLQSPPGLPRPDGRPRRRRRRRGHPRGAGGVLELKPRCIRSTPRAPTGSSARTSARRTARGERRPAVPVEPSRRSNRARSLTYDEDNAAVRWSRSTPATAAPTLGARP